MNGNTSCTVAGAADDVVTATPSSPRTAVVAVSPPPVGAIKVAKVALTFISRSSDKDLVVATSRIVNGMTGNLSYPTPAPTLVAVAAARDALLAAINVANGSKLTIASRRQLRPALEGLLRQLAQYVQTASNGDPLVLTGSGFPLHRGRQPVGVLPAPTNLRLSRGLISGQLRARCKVVAQAASYQWRVASAAAPTVWLPADPTVAANATLQGLTPGTQYIVQVRAIGSKGPSDWSDATMQIAM
jgi:hypothetical protein